ncbi:MAG: hypothetical protein FWF65_08880 [Bacteroidetes bacterium]|nr:hypothetical protein [Bacteroidota bacterium]
MNDRILFYEQQKFRQPWFWILIIMAFGIPLISLIKQWVQSNNPTSGKELIMSILIFLALAVIFVSLFIIMRLETVITTDGVSVRFFPIHRSFRNYRWEDIATYSVKKYSPLKEFGGWGIRFRIARSAIAYSISGNHGLQLELKKGKRILIGTKKQYEMEQALKKVEQIKNRNQLNIM